MRATIYCRISSDREGAGLGVGTQQADCRALADNLGWPVVSVHTDNDMSAYSGKPRPGYRALLQQIRTGEVDAVLAWHTDRLHRSPTELEEFVLACDARGVVTHTVKAGHIDLSTPSGRLVARQLGAVARYEVEHSIERMQRAKLRSASAGVWKGGRRPYGFDDDGITVRQAEAQAILDASAAVLAGRSLRGIAAEWNATGSVTSTGGAWTSSSVRRVLQRPRNAGLMEHRGEVVGLAGWPAIVPEEQWRAVGALLANPDRLTSTGPARKWLGSGLYRCGVCQDVLVTTMVNRRRSYRCRAGHITRTMADVDKFVDTVIAARLRRPDFAEKLAKIVIVDTGALETQAMTLRARLDELAGLYAVETIDAQQLAKGTTELRERLAAVRAEISTAYSGTAFAGIADAPDPGAAWLNAKLDRKRAVLAAVATVTLLKGAGGRPAGWRAGQSYFRHDLVDIDWMQL